MVLPAGIFPRSRKEFTFDCPIDGTTNAQTNNAQTTITIFILKTWSLYCKFQTLG